MELEDSLKSRFPDLAKEWDYDKNGDLTPENVFPGSHTNVYWICPICKQSYPKKVCNRTAPSKRKTESKKCPVCLGRYIIPGVNSLKAKFPDIVNNEWDYDKNKIDPDTIPPHKNKPIFWWKCPNGHSYQASINNKTSGTGGNCSYCSHQKLSSEFSLAVINPNLSKEWDYKSNDPLTPESAFANSNKTVYWICGKCGYKWPAKIDNRNNGKGCPQCNKGTHSSFPEQVILYYIKNLFPDTLNGYKIGNTEIDIFIPSLMIGFEYDGEYYHKSKTKYNKDCYKNRLLKDNGIKLVRIREEGCYPMNNDDCEIHIVKYSSDYKNLIPVLQKIIDDLCTQQKNKKEIRVDIEKIRTKILSKLHVLPFERSFAAYIEKCKSQGQILKGVWDDHANYPLTPEMVQPKSDKMVSWICVINSTHRWLAPIKSITSGYGCSRCAKRHNYTNSEWIEAARKMHEDRYDYSKVNYINSKTPVIIICPIHGEFTQCPSEHLKGKGCKYCVHQSFHPFECLAILHPEIAAEWDNKLNKETGYTPETIGIDSKKQFYWHCNNGKPHSYHSTIAYRVKRKSGCAICHGKQVDFFTSIECLRPDLVAEWSKDNKYKPSEVSIGSEKKNLWKCSNPDHKPFLASVYNRAHLNSGCPECAGNIKTTLTYSKELYNKFPNIELLSEYKKSSEKIECRCNICGYVWTPYPHHLLKGKGCPACLKYKK